MKLHPWQVRWIWWLTLLPDDLETYSELLHPYSKLGYLVMVKEDGTAVWSA